MNNKLEKIIDREHKKYDSWIKNKKELPEQVINRAWTGLLLLTQSTSEDDSLTENIIDIAIELKPVISENISYYNRSKYESLINKNSPIHNSGPDKKRCRENLEMVCAPLEYILNWYFESDEEVPFDLKNFSEMYSSLKCTLNKVES
jgi:hypothetical protein